MKNSNLRMLLLSGAAVMTSTTSAHADTGTAAGTSISNTASVSYTVNGSAQTTSSTTSTFVVDRKVNFTVVRDQPGNTQVNLSEQGAYVKFKVTNTTNGTQDFLLDPDQDILNLGAILPGTDDFNISGMKAYVDSNGNGVYDSGVDTAEFIDELAPDASATVFLVGNVPAASANLAFVSLHVIAAAGGAGGTKGSALIATDLNLANADNTIDIVFADDDSDAALLGDVLRNGQGRAYGAFELGTRNVALTVTKTARIVADDLGLLNPKAVPGATVEYCFVVHNGTLLTAASNVVLTDDIPANTTYVPGSISLGGLGVGNVCLTSGSTEDDDADDAAESDGYTASFDGSAKKVTATIPTVGGGASIAASFRVKIN
jgi:uncharacterized repeat protein (TIGR01451 family)